jgi:hypothetical protein
MRLLAHELVHVIQQTAASSGRRARISLFENSHKRVV